MVRVRQRSRVSGHLVEIPLLTAGYALVMALLVPRFYPTQPLGLLALWLLGLGVARLFCNGFFYEDMKKALGVPLYVWSYLGLSLLPALSLWAGFPPGGFLVVLLPYLAYRAQLWAETRASAEG